MHLGAWPGGSWLPWRAAPLLLCSCSCLVSERLPQEWSYLSFHLFTCTMGFAPIKWTCTAFFRPRQLTDRAILAIRQTQEKKKVKSLACEVCFLVGPCTWEPGQGVPGCRGSAPFCCVLVLVWFLRDFRRNGPIFRFTFSPAQWASPQLNGPVQRSSDRDS